MTHHARMELVLTTIHVNALRATQVVHVTVSVRVSYNHRVTMNYIILPSVYTECTQNPCRNQGTCQILAGSYLCTCTPEYTGDFCEDGTVYKSFTLLHFTIIFCVEIPTTASPTESTEATEAPIDNNQLFIIIGAFGGGALLILIVVVIVTMVSVLCICRKAKKYAEMDPAEGFPEKNNAYEYMMNS